MSKTNVTIRGVKFLIDGTPAYAGRKDIEGFLYNIRTVNATFDDTLGKLDLFDDDGSRPRKFT